jgi:hypothetical protein
MTSLRKLLFSALLSVLAWHSDARACPSVQGLPDFNCDGVFTIAFFGDSITRGRTDPLYDGRSGAVPLRLHNRLKSTISSKRFKVLNFGTPGITCRTLRGNVRTAIRRNTSGVASSDVAVFACGINDSLKGLSTESAFLDLRQMQNFSKEQGMFSVVANVSRTGTAPLQRWIDRLNFKIKSLGGYLRYDRLTPSTMLVPDKIHPNGPGFSFMFSTFYAFLTSSSFTSLGKEQLQLSDLDSDNVYDSFELSKFGTDPTLADTDGDLLSDGQEVFTYKTNPLAVDTDADGVSDGIEVANGTNPRA